MGQGEGGEVVDELHAREMDSLPGVQNKEAAVGGVAVRDDTHGGTETRRVTCEVYSRIVGYLRPVQDWNKAKRQEFSDRATYEVGHGND